MLDKLPYMLTCSSYSFYYLIHNLIARIFIDAKHQIFILLCNKNMVRSSKNRWCKAIKTDRAKQQIFMVQSNKKQGFLV